jgi:predicted RNA-binding Zn-ribbon protein involved in translation (DUF1610 family)
MARQKSKVYLVSDEEFTTLVKESPSYSEILRKLGLAPKGGSSTDTLKRRIEELKLDVNHFTRAIPTPNSARYTMEEILVEDSTYANISCLKKRLINEKILEYKCAICGNLGEWNGQPLTLQLDHMNGKNNDHRKENLRFLCPNCHTQTDTFAGKNK